MDTAYAEEALTAFSEYALALAAQHPRGLEPVLVLYSDGSGYTMHDKQFLFGFGSLEELIRQIIRYREEHDL